MSCPKMPKFFILSFSICTWGDVIIWTLLSSLSSCQNRFALPGIFQTHWSSLIPWIHVAVLAQTLWPWHFLYLQHFPNISSHGVIFPSFGLSNITPQSDFVQLFEVWLPVFIEHLSTWLHLIEHLLLFRVLMTVVNFSSSSLG